MAKSSTDRDGSVMACYGFRRLGRLRNQQGGLDDHSGPGLGDRCSPGTQQHARLLGQQVTTASCDLTQLRDRSIQSSGPRAGAFLVGYFASVESINDGGRPIELADLLIEQGS